MKRAFAIILAFLLCTNSFAAIVSDNDGAAFVTKGEFEALKADFAKQVTNYNESIEGKIDGAIAAYLAGLRVAEFIPMTLDGKCKYSFPLYYDPNYYWDNYNISVGYKLFVPEFHKISYYMTSHGFVTPNSSGDGANWATGNKTTGRASITATQIYNTSFTKTLSCMTACRWKYDYSGKNGLLNLVTRTSETRKINSTDYNVYSLDDEGIGRFIHSYAATADTNTGNGNMFVTSGNYSTGASGLIAVNKDYQFTVSGSGASGTRYSVTEPTGSFTKQVMTKTSCVGAGVEWANQTNITTSFPNGTTMTASKISEIIHGQSGSASKLNRIYWNTKPLAEATKYTTANVRKYIFSRDLFMPANTDSNYALTADLQKGNDTTFTIVGGGSSTLLNIVAFSKTAITAYNKPQINVMALPPLKRYIWHSSSKYAPATTDAFSYLPATLVTYKDSNDKTHYMDEGMFLGTFERSGEVRFTVKFTKRYGTGTKLRLHVSKVPFSKGYSTSNYVDYYINNTKGNNQQVDYGTSYNIRVPDVAKNDELYFEWVPVTTSDLSSLDSFTGFGIVANE